MNHRQREVIAKQIAAIAEKHGGSVEFDHDPRYQETRVEARFESVSFSTDIGGPNAAVRAAIVVSFYGAEHPMNPRVMPAVNACHGHKATLTAATWPALYPELERICAAIASGEAFL